MRHVALPLLLAAVLGGRAAAQAPQSLGPRTELFAHESARWADSLRFGRRIRVEGGPRDSVAGRREGTFVSITRDSVIYRPVGVDSMLAVSLLDVSGLWVSGRRLTRVQSAAGGALLGALVGSAVVGIRSSRDVRDPAFGPPRGGELARASLVGASVGLLLGLASGGLEDWHRVWPPQP